MNTLTNFVHYRRPAVTVFAGDEAQHVFPETVEVTVCDTHKSLLSMLTYHDQGNNAAWMGKPCDFCECERDQDSFLTVILERVTGV